MPTRTESITMNRWRGTFACLSWLCATSGGAAVVGVDPLSVLDTQPKANAVILLDSSGAMRDTLDATGTAISKGALVGGDRHSKLSLAKHALASVLGRNQARVRVKLGSFSQDTADGA